uniref:Uncharacterized protein n=1 Tax=Glossina palpalis gambiensis TaxID=67801 RepID=A0A1B0BED8_9MUSC
MKRLLEYLLHTWVSIEKLFLLEKEELRKENLLTETKGKNSKTTSITKKLFYYSIKNTTTKTTTTTKTYNTYLEKSKSLQRENKRQKKKKT